MDGQCPRSESDSSESGAEKKKSESSERADTESTSELADERERLSSSDDSRGWTASLDGQPFRIVVGELRNCIRSHGPITSDLIGSAAKRIALAIVAASNDRTAALESEIENLIHNIQLRDEVGAEVEEEMLGLENQVEKLQLAVVWSAEKRVAIIASYQGLTYWAGPGEKRRFVRCDVGDPASIVTAIENEMESDEVNCLSPALSPAPTGDK